MSACLRLLWAEDRETMVHKPTFGDLETVRDRWLGHCAPRCHREAPARGPKLPHGLLAQRIPGCCHANHQLTRSPRRLSLGGAPRAPAAGHAEGRMGQFLSCSADLSSNPLGPTPLDPDGAERGAAKISVSILRADQLHVETERTACTFCLPWAQPGSLAELEGGGEGVEVREQWVTASAHPPEAKGEKGGSVLALQLPRLPVCLGLIPV